ncbi:hypothetical protein ES695_11155 [Candidatus Atribacteria bacterium 1244-E10-H5-B2]|nr:MAG: hypothetical protein ES695_11155 [Candidatus Atribacteria bacterium 1244-E10-H5-B2]
MAKNTKFRKKSSYEANSPEAKARQVEGRQRYYEEIRHEKKAIEVEKEPPKSPFDIIYKNDIVKFLEDHYFLIETLKPVILESWQKQRIFKPLFELDNEGLRKYSLALVGLPKKNSKSTMASMIANYFMFQDCNFGEIILTANSKEQSSWIIFNKLKKSLQMNKKQLREIKLYEDVIEVKKTGTVCRIVAPNYRTASGSNPSLTIWDEIWAMELDSSRKFWDELCEVPTRKNPLSLVVSYAGFDEDSLLYELYQKGLAKTDKAMFFLWSHKNLASWVSKKYLDSQRGRLRPNTYLRLHENRWTSSESAFVSPEMWDACIDPNIRPILPGFQGQLSIGIDIGYSHDSSSVVGVYREGDKVILAFHKCWIPTKTHRIDIEETVEKYLIELHKNFNVDSFNYDPYQFHRSGVSLAKEGLKMVEFPQTQDRLIEAGENLYSLIKGRNLVVYRDKEVRGHILKSIAKESARGFRLIKSKQSDRIDLAVSTAMACIKAVNLDTGGARVRWLDEPDHMSAKEARKERLREWIEGDDDDFDDIDRSHILPENYNQI